MPATLSPLAELLEEFRRDGLLSEPEGLRLLAALGIDVPRHLVLAPGAVVDASWLDALPGERVVLKVVAPDIAHKSDVGGVLIVAKEVGAVRAGLATLAERFAGRLTGVLVAEFIADASGPGAELLLGLRWTDDFGPVVTLGAGGIYAEFLAGQSGPGGGVALLSPALPPDDLEARLLEMAPILRLATGQLRGQKPRVALAEVARVVRAFLQLAAEAGGAPLLEFEINPLVAVGGRLVALDALGRLTSAPRPAPPARPVDKLARLFTPRSVAVIGVSEKMNPGRIIVRNLLREGFDPARIAIIKPEATTIDGCRCWPSLAALPEPVDLCVLAISAAQAPGTLEEILALEKAESLIVIPGGLEEKAGAEEIVARLHAKLAGSRATSWRGPVVCGGNSLGVRSLPGRIDTLFIPEAKLPLRGPAAPIALISNSGAFAVARAGKLGGLNPRYVVTAGNQMDLTLGDYLTFLAEDPEVKVFAVYVEGFRPLDGLRFAAATRAITRGGRSVVLYRGGRTAAGAAASASHTAAIAGDYAVTRALAREAGALVAESLEEFEEFVRLIARLGSRRPAGPRLGALTNAGFECVAIADNLGPFTLAALSADTRVALAGVFERARIASIVDVHNPLDLTPMADDAAYAEAARLVLADPNVDVGLIGCVPLTAALATGAGELDRPDGVAERLIRLHVESTKPWVAVIDGGPLFDALAARLEAGGIPTFRSADRALRALGRWAGTAYFSR